MSAVVKLAAVAGPTMADRDAMQRDGFLVVHGLFDAAAVADVLHWTAELEAAPEQPGRDYVFRV